MRYKFGFDKHSLSTQVYIVLCVGAGILGCLGWASNYFQWFNTEDMFFIFREILTVDVIKCFLFSGVCLLLGVGGWFIDRFCITCTEFRGKLRFEVDYDLDSNVLVGVSVAISVLCAILVIPKLNSWMMIQQYGHEMGIMTDYWDHEMAIIASLQKIVMYILSIPTVILLMRQWIRMVVNTNSNIIISVIKVVTFPLYPACAIVLCYCISELLAIVFFVAILIGIVRLVGGIGETMMNTKQADEIDRTDDLIAMEYVDEKVLNILANNPFGQYKWGNELIAKEIKRKRDENYNRLFG